MTSARRTSPRARAALAYLALFSGIGALFPYTTLYFQARGLDFAQIGVLLALGSLLGLAAGPAWGSVSDRAAGSPRVLLGSAAVSIVGLVLLAAAADLVAILVANVVLGAGLAGLAPIIDARAIETAGDDRAGYGPLRAWGSVGWVASSLLTGLAVQAWGLEVMFVAAGLGLAATALIGLRLAPAASTRVERPLRAALRIFRAPRLLLFLGGMLLGFAAMGAALNFFPLRFAELGAGAGLIGLASAVAAAIEVPVMLRFPSLVRRFGGTRLLVAGAVVVAGRTAIAAVAVEPAVLVLASLVGGVGYALFAVGGVTYVAEQVPRELAATGQGVFQGISISLSSVVAAVAGGLLSGALGIPGMFAVAAAAGAAAALVVALAVLPAPRSAWVSR